MNSKEILRAKVNETFSKNSLGIHTDRYEYVQCIKLGEKGDFSAFSKQTKEKHSAPISKTHIPSVSCKCSVLLVKNTYHRQISHKLSSQEIVAYWEDCLCHYGFSRELIESCLLHDVYCLLQLQQKSWEQVSKNSKEIESARKNKLQDL